MVEADVQDAVYWWARRKHHEPICPNVHCWRWESDLVSVTRSLRSHEFEVKTSRQDLLAEWRASASADKRVRLKCMRGEMAGGPNYFWYALAPDVAAPDEIPEWAGVLVVNGYIEVVRSAPLRHAERINRRKVDYMQRGLMFRYWDQRLKERREGAGA